VHNYQFFKLTVVLQPGNPVTTALPPLMHVTDQAERV